MTGHKAPASPLPPPCVQACQMRMWRSPRTRWKQHWWHSLPLVACGCCSGAVWRPREGMRRAKSPTRGFLVESQCMWVRASALVSLAPALPGHSTAGVCPTRDVLSHRLNRSLCASACGAAGALVRVGGARRDNNISICLRTPANASKLHAWCVWRWHMETRLARAQLHIAVTVCGRWERGRRYVVSWHGNCFKATRRLGLQAM